MRSLFCLFGAPDIDPGILLGFVSQSLVFFMLCLLNCYFCRNFLFAKVFILSTFETESPFGIFCLCSYKMSYV